MNVELLRKIEERILSDPKSFDMNFFENETECGTTYCIGGWARKLSGNGELEALGITEEQGHRLFFVENFDGDKDNWPKQFLGLTSKWSPTPQQAVDRIEHFIATEGRE